MTQEAQNDERSIIEDKDLEELLDVVDERTKVQEMLHEHIGDGFMSLARERYRQPSSAERLGRLVYDDRDEVKSNVHVAIEVNGDRDIVTMSREFEETSSAIGDAGSTMRRRKGKDDNSTNVREDSRVIRHADVRNSFMAVPSKEVREAIRSFRQAIDQAIELANRNSQLEAEIAARTCS